MSERVNPIGGMMTNLQVVQNGEQADEERSSGAGRALVDRIALVGRAQPPEP
ncbi:MAG: hypothetical protein U0271_48065 [Polyangiaceae bacterium]